ncbi:hypothetical protein JFK97_19975 [Chromobacterium phragmitis]|uniref:glycosyl hydrolase family 28-related protein n=1 Tax=Chromobacterium amazonense TaxID=1382803 RepID=UPI0021B81D4A|nr:glycosyl hydrolase family 28-related protein [Chromobacterium amazonense]MBM2886673.1 hypothetical protein [Chromobacterium amazonense]MDE1715414.1 glycosyl hydrolase family 28-related protein [Chromobacterium amazonense]
MTISSQNRQAGPYLGNDVATAFTFAFKVFSASDLQVVRTDAAGVESTLALTTDYTVALNSNQDSNPGGTVTLVAGALVSGTKLTITSSIIPLQATDLTNQGGFYPKVITNALDKLTILIQQLLNGLGRSIKLPISDSAMNVTLPAASVRASKALGFDANGQPIAVPAGSAVTDSGAVTFTTSGSYSAGTVGKWLKDLASSIGSSLIGFIQSGIGAVARTVQDELRQTVSVKQFGAVGDGVTDDTAAIRAAIASLATSGGIVLIPRGTYLVSSAIQTYSNITIKGEGDSSQILVATDIEVFYSDRTTISTSIFRAEFRDFYIKKTFTGATTKYDIHLQNPNVCKFSNVRIQSGHIDSAYSATNVGGIFLDKPAGSTASAFMNRIDDCWIQNNSIYLLNITDSSIKGGYVWGHVRQFAIRLGGASAGNIDIIGVNGIITSQYNGGIWLDGSGINQVRIIGNEWDGNPLLTLGTGIYSPQSTFQVAVSGNTFWGCGKHGIDTTDPVGWSITGNNFWKGNAQDNSYDDIRITGVTFQPNGNTVTGNSHTIDVSRTNKGYAIREVNGGFNPFGNTYSSNSVLGGTGYQNPAILVLQSADQVGNVGMGTNNSLRLMQDQIRLDYEATLVKTARTQVAASGGTLDLTITTESGNGAPAAQGSYVGTLYVSVSRPDYTPQSRRTVWAAIGYGTTLSTTSLAQQDGTGGGPTYTITAPSNGVIRFTNTFASAVTVDMMFVGTKGFAGA